MASKSKFKNRVLERIISNENIKSLLEIGAGNSSTFKIRQVLKKKESGYCLSLEAHSGYYESVKSKLPDDDYGRLEFSPLVYDGASIVYSHSFSEKFDFIYIDGPGNTDVTDTRTGNLVDHAKIIKNVLSDKKIWVNAEYPHGGRSSIFIMDYVLSSMKKHTIILVDSRKMSVMYFYQKYHNLYNFISLGLPMKKINFRKMIKKNYNIDCFVPHVLTLITNKDSKKAKKIISSLSLEEFKNAAM